MQNQKGSALIITFLIMTIILAIVLSLTLILFNEIKILRNIGDSVSAFYAAETGIEKTLYFDRKKAPPGAVRGFCDLCNQCNLANPGDCNSCTTSTINNDPNGCNSTTCNNCQITYNSTFEGATFDYRTYQINSTVTDIVSPGTSVFNIKSKGFYKETIRAVETISTSP